MQAGDNMTKILYVDDEINATSAVRRQLKGKYELYTAGNGNKALDILKNHDGVAVIIVDYSMPNMNGIEFIQKARVISPHTVFIMLTGHADLDLAINALHEGEIYRFLTKPCPAKVLEKSIDDAIEKYGIIELKDRLASTANELETVNNTLRVRMVQLQELYNQLELARAEDENEMQMAREVFDRLIYAHNNDAPYLKFWMSPMSTFSGDLILSDRSPSGKVYIMLADFTGHGLPAAIGAPLVAKIFIYMIEYDATLPEIIAEINRSLYAVLPTNLFCAAGLMEFDCRINKVSIWNGGLPDIILTENDGSIMAKIKSSHLPFGIAENNIGDINCEIFEVDKNSSILFYSDGLIEAHDESGDSYGSSRLENILSIKENSKDLFDRVKKDINKFMGDADQHDDITIANLVFNEIKPIETFKSPKLVNI